MPFLFDTNIFLEILLDQEKKEDSKALLSQNAGQIFFSDFSLHSIGLILIRQNKFNVFDKFLKDILPHATILSLPAEKYIELNKLAKKYKLDFDDSYQTCIALEYELDLVTMDSDFNAVKDILKINFI
jgi:predicted nucleic acid-binding protein